jgi:hypothetical protein
VFFAVPPRIRRTSPHEHAIKPRSATIHQLNIDELCRVSQIVSLGAQSMSF